MRVICTGDVVTIEDRARWHRTSEQESFPNLDQGKEYLVLGIMIYPGGPYGCVPLLQIDAFGSGTILSYPLTLFRITDERVSRYWQTHFDPEDGTLMLWPELFYTRAFIDRLSNGEEELEKRYRELWRLMEAEHREERD